MSYLKVNLDNLIVGKKYNISTIFGNGVVDYDGWSGVATTTSGHYVMLNGFGLNKVEIRMVQLYNYNGDTFDVDMDPNLWTLYDDSNYRTRRYSGYLEFLQSNSYANSGGKLVSNHNLEYGSDFDLEFVPLSFGGNGNNTKLTISFGDRLVVEVVADRLQHTSIIYYYTNNGLRVSQNGTDSQGLSSSYRFTRDNGTTTIYRNGAFVVSDYSNDSVPITVKYVMTYGGSTDYEYWRLDSIVGGCSFALT